jgi:GNAT superfamily N-acetyltransferase
LISRPPRCPPLGGRPRPPHRPARRGRRRRLVGPDRRLHRRRRNPPAARGQGLGRGVCTYVITQALARHGTAALIVDDDNAPARRLYRALGLAYRPLRAAAVATAA